MESNNIENEGHLVQWKQTVDDLGWLLVQHGDTNGTYIPSGNISGKSVHISIEVVSDDGLYEATIVLQDFYI